MLETTVGEIADLLKDAKAGGPKACLLIGAGVSKTAGIGLASDYVLRIKERYPQVYAATCIKCAGGREPSYAECMAALPPAKQVQLVREDIDRAKINWAHIGLARLESAEIVDTILTPNFDPLASRACALFHRFPAIYDLAGLRNDSEDHIEFDRSYVKGSAIFHLHGQHTGFLLLNTAEKLLAQARRIRPVLDAAMKGKPVIIAGYSGENDPLVNEIAAMAPFNHGLFWVSHDEIEPPRNVLEALLTKPNCALVRGMPADRFFTELANGLDITAPEFMFNPFEHMLSVLGTIEQYDADGESPQDNLLSQARSRLRQAGGVAMDRASSPSEIAELMSKGRYEEVWSKYGGSADSLDISHRDQVVWAAIGLGNNLGDRAKGCSAVEAGALFARAYSMYSGAMTLDARNASVYYNWAVTLSDHASFMVANGTDSGDESVRALRLEAEEKYASSYNISEKTPRVLNNWGTLIWMRANYELKAGRNYHDVYISACSKFEEATRADPHYINAWMGWANMETHFAQFAEPEESRRMYESASEKYRTAVEIDPKNASVMVDWADAIVARAALSKEREIGDHLFDEAIQKYSLAASMDPSVAEVWYSWGNALLRMVQEADAKAAEKLLLEAKEKYSKALKLDSRHLGAFVNRGNVNFRLAGVGTSESREAHLRDAISDYEAASQIDANDSDNLNNWGVAITMLAALKESLESVELCERAFDKFAIVTDLGKSDADTSVNWGNALRVKALHCPAESRDEVYKSAYAKFKHALSLNPKMANALESWAGTLVEEAKAKPEELAVRLIAQSKSKATRARKLRSAASAARAT